MSGCPASEGNIGSRMDTQAFQAQLVMVCGGPRTLPWNSDRFWPDFDPVLLYEICAQRAVLLYFGRT